MLVLMAALAARAQSLVGTLASRRRKLFHILGCLKFREMAIATFDGRVSVTEGKAHSRMSKGLDAARPSDNVEVATLMVLVTFSASTLPQGGMVALAFLNSLLKRLVAAQTARRFDTTATGVAIGAVARALQGGVR